MKKIRNHSLLLASISAIALILSVNVHAKIYKWTDANGQVHYSAQPPKPSEKISKAEDIEEKIRNHAGKYRPSTAKKSKASSETTQKNEEEKIVLSGPSNELKQYCKNQKNTLAQLKKNFRNVWIDAEGNRTMLDQKQRQEKVNLIANQIKQDCSEVKLAQN